MNITFLWRGQPNQVLCRGFVKASAASPSFSLWLLSISGLAQNALSILDRVSIPYPTWVGSGVCAVPFHRVALERKFHSFIG